MKRRDSENFVNIKITITISIIMAAIFIIFLLFGFKDNVTADKQESEIKSSAWVDTGIGFIKGDSHMVNYKYLSYIAGGKECLRIYNNGECKIMTDSKKEFMEGMKFFAERLWEQQMENKK